MVHTGALSGRGLVGLAEEVVKKVGREVVIEVGGRTGEGYGSRVHQRVRLTATTLTYGRKRSEC